jgi:hypothetical protein
MLLIVVPAGIAPEDTATGTDEEALVDPVPSWPLEFEPNA